MRDERDARTSFPRGSAALLALAGVILVGMELYFVFLRPPLLPEDQRYIGASLAQLETTAPGVPRWLRHVFRVLGSYVISTGVLTAYLAATSFRLRAPGAVEVAALAGLASIALMAVINFVIDSDFKWLLLGFARIWAAAIGLWGVGQ